MNDIETRLAETPDRALRALWRRAAIELGVLPPPAGTRRVERSFSLPMTPGSMNDNDHRSHWKPGHAEKKEWQGRLMRELHRLDLDRPIRRVGPLWAHVTLQLPVVRERDTIDNWHYPTAKPLGDALTGPTWTGYGKARRPAHRAMIYQGARYVGGWLDRDTDDDWTFTLAISDETGPARTTIRLVWDEPLVST